MDHSRRMRALRSLQEEVDSHSWRQCSHGLRVRTIFDIISRHWAGRPPDKSKTAGGTLAGDAHQVSCVRRTYRIRRTIEYVHEDPPARTSGLLEFAGVLTPMFAKSAMVEQTSTTCAHIPPTGFQIKPLENSVEPTRRRRLTLSSIWSGESSVRYVWYCRGQS